MALIELSPDEVAEAKKHAAKIQANDTVKRAKKGGSASGFRVDDCDLIGRLGEMAFSKLLTMCGKAHDFTTVTTKPDEGDVWMRLGKDRTRFEFDVKTVGSKRARYCCEQLRKLDIHLSDYYVGMQRIENHLIEFRGVIRGREFYDGTFDWKKCGMVQENRGVLFTKLPTKPQQFIQAICNDVRDYGDGELP